MRVLVTGAGGFVGRWACAALAEAGHRVIPCVRDTSRGSPELENLAQAGVGAPIRLDLDEDATIEAALATGPDAILHLAAIASGAQARRAPVRAWQVNAVGTVRLAGHLERLPRPPRVVFASTGEVYGRGTGRPSRETDPTRPCSPYAGSKLAAEVALAEAAERTGLPVVLARCFAQTGPGQTRDYVVPAFVARILEASRTGQTSISVGNLDPVREFIDVRDVAVALRLLVEHEHVTGPVNVARGEGTSLTTLLERIQAVAGWRGTAVVDPSLVRQADIPYLVGDGSLLAGLGWRAERSLDASIADVLTNLRQAP